MEPDRHLSDRTRWRVHGERLVDATRRDRWSIAAVELPDGTRFEQYVLRTPPAAVVVVLDAVGRVLMMRRHRFIIDRWVWELPGGFVDPEEDPALTAAREVEEETGWRPSHLQRLLSFQPMVGTADSENILFLARDAEFTSGTTDINEAEQVSWVPLDTVLGLIVGGEIVGSASIIGLLHVLATSHRQTHVTEGR